MKPYLLSVFAGLLSVAAPLSVAAQDAGGHRVAYNSLGGSSVTTVAVTDERKSAIRATIAASRGAALRIPKASLGDAAISIGALLPREKVRISRLPAAVVQLVPEYAAYEYFVTDDGQIVIVDPDSYAVVDVIA
ncbi:DUF1236 domain-containing protein [Methylopila sp. M107]|uniref:DUF1236 domain-containing protein n=1 Tax=Methylopila sp. M107 TaxID=1101190 RepID=UPI0003617D2C|nr:DUF1236 domain-containing protein [Methylopila sp. M107]